MKEDSFEGYINNLDLQTLTDELKQEIIEKFYDYKFQMF